MDNICNLNAEIKDPATDSERLIEAKKELAKEEAEKAAHDKENTIIRRELNKATVIGKACLRARETADRQRGGGGSAGRATKNCSINGLLQIHIDDMSAQDFPNPSKESTDGLARMTSSLTACTDYRTNECFAFLGAQGGGSKTSAYQVDILLATILLQYDGEKYLEIVADCGTSLPYEHFVRSSRHFHRATATLQWATAPQHYHWSSPCPRGR